ncbi:MAG: hypothetical protein A2107_02450 [Verrucomicrobia bacterium GWF2_62_7]|nr:MAG: hypothetical protein A2107_02450 [Verrucomicrobia bacterium GWF2_62_7]
MAYAPAGLATGGTAALMVESAGKMGEPITVVVTAFSPLLYTRDDSNTVLGWCEDTVSVITAESPALPGCLLHVYGSGLDLKTPAVAVVGGAVIEETAAGKLEGQPGLHELVFRLPAGLAEAAEVELKVVQGSLTSNTVAVPIRRQ